MGRALLRLILSLAVMGNLMLGQEVEHRPGALFVRRGTVSMAGSVYRVLIHLQPYFFDAELGAMKTFMSSARNLLAEIGKRKNDSVVVSGTVQAFKSQIQRAATSYTDLVSKNDVLKAYYPESSKWIRPHGPDHRRRPFRQESIANLFGLASYSQIKDLQAWAAETTETSERILHVVDQQYTYLNKSFDRINDQENRLNRLTSLSADWATKLNAVSKETQSIALLQAAQEATLALLKGSLTLLEYTAELRVLLDEALDRARDLFSGRVPLSLLSPSEFNEIMEEARSLLPADYSFSISPSEMALSLNMASITVITKGEVAPYYGVLEFPIHRGSYQLYRVLPVGVGGSSDPSIMGYYEIVDVLLAVSADKHFTLSAAEVRNCLSNIALNDPSDHYCTPVTSIGVYDPTVPPGSCAAAVYYGSSFIPDLCPQVATLVNRTIFTHVQQNQWAYSAPNPAYLLRVFCPPDGEETHSSVALNQQGGLVQIPEGCSGKYGSEILPATFRVQTKFRVSAPVHRPFSHLEVDHWRPITMQKGVDAVVLTKLKGSLGNSSQLSMPLRQYEAQLNSLRRDLARSKLHKIYHSPAFAPTLSVSTVVLVIIGSAIVIMIVRRARARRDAAGSAVERASTPQASIHHEMIPLQAISGPAGSTPFHTPSGRRPLPALPVTIREVIDDPDEEQPRSSRRNRRSRSRVRHSQSPMH